MKHLAFLLIGLFALGGSTYAAEENTTVRRGNIYDGSKYIFVEDGIEFSVFPDGEFDFYIPQYVDGVSLNVSAGPVGISFNTGFDYDPYVQYDEYGAVIQIENTPLFYDYYGRLIQAGDVNINYRNNRIARVGGLRVFYNNYGAFSHYSGFINVYNRNYVFHPYHNFYYRPIFNRCLVWTTPYRRFYSPIRYDYAFHRNNYYRGYRNGYANARRDFRRPDRGRVAHNNGRRGNLDRNNARFRNAKPSSRYSNRSKRDGNSRGIAQNDGRSRNSRGTTANTSRRTNDRDNSRATSQRDNTRGAADKARRTNTNRKTSRADVNNRTSKRVANRSGNTTSKRSAARSNDRAKNTQEASQRSTRPSNRATAPRSKNSRSVASTSKRSTQSRKAQRPSQSRKTSTARNTSRKSAPKASRSTKTRKASPQRSSRSSNANRKASSKRNSSSRARRG